MAQYSVANTLIDKIKELADRGFTDPQIAVRVGLNRVAVGATRRRYGIKPAVAPGVSKTKPEVFGPLREDEIMRLRRLVHAQTRQRRGFCQRCRRHYRIVDNRVVPHPALGTTVQMGRPCAGSGRWALDVDREVPRD